MANRVFNLMPFVLVIGAIATIIILVSVYYKREDSSVRTDKSVAYKHSQVKHGKAKVY